MKKSVKVLLVILLVFVFLFGLMAVLYPLISNSENEKHQSEVQAEYHDAVEQAEDANITAAREAAIQYNEMLAHGTLEERNSTLPEYVDLLNLSGNGVMGYVEIPRLELSLPIYHGDTNDGLEIGVAHLFGTSLPVGGESTHAVISGHSGMASQRMFTDLTSMEIGDIFYIDVLGERLAYQVDQIEQVLPNDNSKIMIESGKDYVTLLTCTPYMINTHRLLVRGTRIEYHAAEKIVEAMPEVKVESEWLRQYWRGIISGLFILLVIILVATVIALIRKGRKKRGAKRKD